MEYSVFCSAVHQIKDEGKTKKEKFAQTTSAEFEEESIR